ncbi:hypothetical protein PMAYCL1PPCAC_24361 [Pristionchus mayeri]|uniref:Uncharacterized protein n=1 Tax=Pristionchus mayeri TaxID=1317129 RepID=A0AAN5I8G8_9BILA|nr:hypothetical protein PMAYCL1PPCAC_24361 [Pristionchus mayeri]
MEATRATKINRCAKFMVECKQFSCSERKASYLPGTVWSYADTQQVPNSRQGHPVQGPAQDAEEIQGRSGPRLRGQGGSGEETTGQDHLRPRPQRSSRNWRRSGDCREI